MEGVMMRLRMVLAGGMAGCIVAGSVSAQVFRGGRTLADERDFSLRATAGQISDFQVMVQETTRRVYDVTGETWKNDTAEGYDLNDFNIDDSHYTFGLALEKGWKYFTMQVDASYVSISSSVVAQRDYYLGIGNKISYNGRTYDRLMIPEGTEFSFDVDGLTLDMRLLFTPFTFHPFEAVQLTPFLDLGVFGYAGMYDIDAGAPKGVKTYQNPPEDFAIGGQADGTLGMGMPQYGGGAELRIGSQHTVNLVVQASYTLLTYDGSSSLLTSSAEREKNADIDHRNLRVRTFLEFPLRSGRCLMAGVEYQQVESEGIISAAAETEAEILANRERFDKEVEFSMTSLKAMVGVAF
jgi:hypothetical protein